MHEPEVERRCRARSGSAASPMTAARRDERRRDRGCPPGSSTASRRRRRTSSSRLEMTMLVLNRLARHGEMQLQPCRSRPAPTTRQTDDQQQRPGQPGEAGPAVANAVAATAPSDELALGADREQPGPVGDRQPEAHQISGVATTAVLTRPRVGDEHAAHHVGVDRRTGSPPRPAISTAPIAQRAEHGERPAREPARRERFAESRTRRSTSRPRARVRLGGCRVSMVVTCSCAARPWPGRSRERSNGAGELAGDARPRDSTTTRSATASTSSSSAPIHTTAAPAAAASRMRSATVRRRPGVEAAGRVAGDHQHRASPASSRASTSFWALPPDRLRTGAAGPAPRTSHASSAAARPPRRGAPSPAATPDRDRARGCRPGSSGRTSAVR